MNLVAVTMPGPGELLIIMLILVLLFGAKRLPELGSSIGKTVKGFRSGMDEALEEDETTTSTDSSDNTPASPDKE